MFYVSHCIPLLGKVLPQFRLQFSILGHMEPAHSVYILIVPAPLFGPNFATPKIV